MVGYSTSTGTDLGIGASPEPIFEQDPNQSWNLGLGEVGNDDSGLFVYKDPVTGLYMRTPDRSYALQQAITPFQQTQTNLSPTPLATSAEDIFAPAVMVLHEDGNWYNFASKPPGRYTMDTTGQSGWQSDENVQGALPTSTVGGTTGTNIGTTTPTQNVTNPNLLDAPIVPVVGEFAQIGGVSSGFDWNPFVYNPITKQMRQETTPGDIFGRASERPLTYADYLNSITPYSGVITPGSGGDYATRLLAPIQNAVASGSASSASPNYRAFTYSDANTQKAIDQLDRALKNALYTTTTTYGGMGNTQPSSTTTLNINKIDKDIRPFLKDNSISIGRSGVSMLDALNDTQRANILNRISAQTGVPVEELASKYSAYHQANKMFFDPSGTGFADLMRSGAADDVRSGIATWSGAGKQIEKANNLLSRENLAKQYTTRDLGVTAEDPIKEIVDSSGNTFYAVYDPTTNSQFVSLDRATADTIASGGEGLTYDEKTGTFYGRKDPGEFTDASFYYLNKPAEGIGRNNQNITDINRMMTIDDFLPTGVSINNATPEQIAQARSALEGQQDLMKTWRNPNRAISEIGKVHENNKFNLTEESDPIRKGGRSYFVNDATGEVNSVKNRKVAEWAADETANDTPFFHKGQYYYIDKDDGQLKKTKNQFLAEGESQYSNYINIRDWEKFLPAGVNATTATPEQKLAAQELFTEQQTGVRELTGPGSVFNLFKSQDLPIPDDFIYFPREITRDFNTLVNMGLNPTKIDPRLTPENVYKNSLEYDKDEGGIGSFVTSFIVPALSLAYGNFAPFIQGASGLYQMSQGDVLGGLMSLAGSRGLFSKILGGNDILSSVTNKISSGLSSTFGMSPKVAGQLANAGLMGGANAVIAALNDRDVLDAFAMGAGAGYLSNAIDSNLKSTISNPNVRNFISSRLTSTVMNAIQSGNINLEQIFAEGFGTGMFSDMDQRMRPT